VSARLPKGINATVDGSRLVFLRKQTLSIHSMQNSTNWAVKIIFKKLFTSRFLYDIIRFAHARFSGCGVNLNEVFTCRFLGSEANI